MKDSSLLLFIRPQGVKAQMTEDVSYPDFSQLVAAYAMFDCRATVKLYAEIFSPTDEDNQSADALVELAQRFAAIISQRQREIVDSIPFKYEPDEAVAKLKELGNRRKELVGFVETRAEGLLQVHLYDVKVNRDVDEQEAASRIGELHFDAEVIEDATRCHPELQETLEKIRSGALNHRRGDKDDFIRAYNQYWTSWLSLQRLEELRAESEARGDTPVLMAESIMRQAWSYQVRVLNPAATLIRRALESGISEQDVVFATAWLIPQIQRFMRQQKAESGDRWRYPGQRLRNSLAREHGEVTAKSMATEFLAPVTENLVAPTFEQVVRLPRIVSNQVSRELHRPSRLSKKVEGEDREIEITIAGEADLLKHEAESVENTASLDSFVNQESELAELVQKAGLSRNEMEIISCLQREDHTNGELAELLKHSPVQIGVEKKRAFDKIRAARESKAA